MNEATCDLQLNIAKKPTPVRDEHPPTTKSRSFNNTSPTTAVHEILDDDDDDNDDKGEQQLHSAVAKVPAQRISFKHESIVLIEDNAVQDSNNAINKQCKQLGAGCSGNDGHFIHEWGQVTKVDSRLDETFLRRASTSTCWCKFSLDQRAVDRKSFESVESSSERNNW